MRVGASAVIVLALATVTLHVPINVLRVNWPLLGAACLLALAAIVAVGMAFTFLLLAGRDTHGYGEIGAGVLYVISGAIFPIGILPACWRRSPPCPRSPIGWSWCGARCFTARPTRCSRASPISRS